MKRLLKFLRVVIVLLLFLSSCKTNSTKHASKYTPSQSMVMPLIDFDAIEYFDIPTHFEHHHSMKKGSRLNRSIPHHLKSRVPEYVISLSNNCKAYYYDLSCTNKDTLCISPLEPSTLGFFVIQCPKVSTILNVNYEFYADYYGNRALYKMDFETDSLDLIHLTQHMFLPANTDKSSSESDSLVGSSKQHIKVLNDRIFIIPSFAWDAGLEVRPVSNDDIKKGTITLPDLGTISYFDGIETRTPGTAEYFDFETKLKRYINWYFSEYKNCIKDNIAFELGNPKYAIVLSDSVKAYYYPNVYSKCLPSFDGMWTSSPISGLGFLVVKTPLFSAILNIEYSITDDNESGDMYFSFDSLGTIYLTEHQIHTNFDNEGNYYEVTAAPITHIIKVLQDSILYEKHDTFED